MEMFSNAVLGDLVNRSLSFLFAEYEEKQKTATVQEELQQLRRLLLRSGTIVEEAERRLVTNRSMRRQLNALRDERFRGYYVLDVVRCQAVPGGDKKEEDSHMMLVLSRFNPAKRVCYRSSDDRETRARVAFDGASSRELQQTVLSLEATINDTKEFIVFLMNCPPLFRQPYSAHMFVDKCMFGRHMEMERVMEFLLQGELPGATNLGVLPIIGQARVGKSTLVEHVCEDERVRDHFSLILFYNQTVLKAETLASFRGNCVIKHQRDDKASGKRLLIVIELIEDVDEETWNMFNSCEESMVHGSRMIITSRSEKIARLGTTHALRIKCLPTEAYWYFLKMAAFGSDDPGQHPKLVSLAFEMANLLQGSFMFATIGAVLLRNNFNTQSWSRVLTRLRDYMQKNVSLIGENHDDFKAKGHRPRFSWSLIKQKPDQYFMLYDVYQSRSGEEVPKVKFVDLQAGSFQPKGRYKILFWKSQIPPYFNYICECEICDM
ncbi:unnamed protein product [Urochloa decumbens]|uniref:NB-ARC domain-containing protein n=1 Tax=Urochloa decumbens TaxID=240449 RepID=A0ABC9D892_9POAL